MFSQVTVLCMLQAAEAAGKAESMAFNAAELSRTAHTKNALKSAIEASQAYNQVIHPIIRVLIALIAHLTHSGQFRCASTLTKPVSRAVAVGTAILSAMYCLRSKNCPDIDFMPLTCPHMLRRCRSTAHFTHSLHRTALCAFVRPLCLDAGQGNGRGRCQDADACCERLAQDGGGGHRAAHTMNS